MLPEQLIQLDPTLFSVFFGQLVVRAHCVVFPRAFNFYIEYEVFRHTNIYVASPEGDAIDIIWPKSCHFFVNASIMFHTYSREEPVQCSMRYFVYSSSVSSSVPSAVNTVRLPSRNLDTILA